MSEDRIRQTVPKWGNLTFKTHEELEEFLEDDETKLRKRIAALEKELEEKEQRRIERERHYQKKILELRAENERLKAELVKVRT